MRKKLEAGNPKIRRCQYKYTPRVYIRKISQQLRGIGGSNHVGFGKNRVMSLAGAIAKVLAEDMALGENSGVSENTEPIPLNLTYFNNPSSHLSRLTSSVDLCPECGSASFVMEEGCKKCYICGYSMC